MKDSINDLICIHHTDSERWLLRPTTCPLCLAVELRETRQVATNNRDWFEALVSDLSKMLDCPPKVTAIMDAIALLKEGK